MFMLGIFVGPPPLLVMLFHCLTFFFNLSCTICIIGKNDIKNKYIVAVVTCI